MMSYQELKKELLNSEKISHLDFLLAESICNIFNLKHPQARIWLSIMHAESRTGQIFFDANQIKLSKEYFSFFEKISLMSFEEVLLPIIQSESSSILTPLISIKGKYCFSKDYEEAFSWIDDLSEILNHSMFSPLNIELSDDQLSDEQQEAINSFFGSKWMILIGGPGRGKTFTAKKMVQPFLKYHSDAKIAITAPTGKAAENLASAISSIAQGLNIEPKTIHSLLGITPTRLLVDSDDKLDVDLIIVDECSMMDLTLFTLLIKKIKLSTKVLMLGDPDQLPPVQGLSPLKLLLDVHRHFPHFSVKKLTIPFRTNRSDLLKLNDGILERDVCKISEAIRSEDINITPLDHFFLHVNEIAENSVENLKNSPLDFSKLYMNKVLTTHNVGPYGSDEINKRCLKVLSSYKNRFQLLVPIIFVENDDKIGVYNGKLAFYSIFDKQPKIYINPELSHSPHLLPKFQLAFAISIHKSQGSEFDHVRLVIQEFNQLSNELIYTAVSRAKRKLSIFGKLENLITNECAKLNSEEFYKNLCLDKIEKSTLKLS